jgi:hypothetical protein
MFLKNGFVLLLALAALASLATSGNGVQRLGPAQLSSTSGISCAVYDTQTIPYVSTVYMNVVSGTTYTVTQVQYGSTWTNMLCFTEVQSTTMVNSQPSMPISFVVVSLAIAFPVLIVGILAVSRIRRPRSYRPSPRTSWFWLSVPALTAGGMLLIASLWQLEIVYIAESNGTTWCPPFLLWSCISPPIARDIWYLGVFVAFVLALIGAVNCARFTKSYDKPS